MKIIKIKQIENEKKKIIKNYLSVGYVESELNKLTEV